MVGSLSEAMNRAARAVTPPSRPVPGSRPTSDDLSALMEERSAVNTDGGKTWADVARICALPVEGPLAAEELEALSQMYSLESAFRGGFRHMEEQARCVATYDAVGGLMAPVPVGRGKTLIALQIASRAYAAGRKKIMILVPSNTVENFMKQVPGIRKWIPANAPIHVLNGARTARQRLARSGVSGVYLMPYSMLSVEDTSELLNFVEPELVIADEVHKLKHPGSGRTKRVAKFLHTHPHCQFVGMSGTITNRSIKDYWHLITWALGDRSPLPVSPWMANTLAAVLDSDSSPSDRQMADWRPLRRWAHAWFPGEDFPVDVSGLRKAYQLRLTSAPGVVSSSGDCMTDTHLILANEPVTALGADRSTLEDLMTQVEERFITPTGEEIAHAIHTHKWMRELTAGFYNQLVWPEPGVLAHRRNLDVDTAEDLLKLAKDHHQAKQDYVKDLKKWFDRQQHIDGLDTPRLVGQSMAQHGSQRVGEHLHQIWTRMKNLEFDDMPIRDRRPVRVCDYKISHATLWAADHQAGGILWYHHQEIGRWLYESLRAAGLDNAVHCPAGANAEMIDVSNRGQLLIASIGAHGTGKNLQHHQHQLVVEWPRGAHVVEQLLGRCHRTGQEAEELTVTTNDTTMFDSMNRAAGLIDAVYQSQTTGHPMRSVFCEYRPLPTIMPPEVLRERGFENQMLDTHQKKAFQARFKKPLADDEEWV